MDFKDGWNVFIIIDRMALGLGTINEGFELGSCLVNFAIVYPPPEWLPSTVTKGGPGHIIVHHEHAEVKGLFLMFAGLCYGESHGVAYCSPTAWSLGHEKGSMIDLGCILRHVADHPGFPLEHGSDSEAEGFSIRFEIEAIHFVLVDCVNVILKGLATSLIVISGAPLIAYLLKNLGTIRNHDLGPILLRRAEPSSRQPEVETCTCKVTLLIAFGKLFSHLHHLVDGLRCLCNSCFLEVVFVVEHQL